jgi:hypothetical protein
MIEKHGLMDRGRTGGGGFPSSRDWNMPTVKCGVVDCVANRNGECICPSLIVIGKDGKCQGVNMREGR